jgi:host factor-I protein
MKRGTAVTGPVNLQDQFLNGMRKENAWLTVELISSEKLSGTIAAFDNFCILLKGSSEQLIYKHAVAAIIPMEREE